MLIYNNNRCSCSNNCLYSKRLPQQDLRIFMHDGRSLPHLYDLVTLRRCSAHHALWHRKERNDEQSRSLLACSNIQPF